MRLRVHHTSHNSCDRNKKLLLADERKYAKNKKSTSWPVMTDVLTSMESHLKDIQSRLKQQAQHNASMFKSQVKLEVLFNLNTTDS